MTARRVPAAILAAGLLMGALPFLKLPAFYESFLYLALFWIVLATSWNILSGYAGYFSFGHGAFFGAGVYTSATLAAKFNWPFLWTLPVAALVAAAIGVGVGAVVFRVRGVRGEVFALLTLAVTFVLATIIGNTPIDGGPGVYLNAVPVPRLGPSPTSSLYLMMLAAAVATLLASARASLPSTTTRTRPRSWACRPTAGSWRRWRSPARWPGSRAASTRCSSLM